MTTNPTDRRDRIADVLAAADGWQWVTDRDKARSSTYRSYQSRADAVLGVLPSAAPTPPTDKADAGSGRAAEAELYVLLRKAGEDRYEAQALIDRHRDEVLHRAELRRLTAEAQQQDPAAHGCTINGQPAMPILVTEYNQLVTRAAEAETRADRTAVLREAADELDGVSAQFDIDACDCGNCTLCAWKDAARHLRRMADETQQQIDTETPAAGPGKCTATIAREDQPDTPDRCIAPAGHYDEAHEPTFTGPDRNPGGWHTNGKGHAWSDRAAAATPHAEPAAVQPAADTTQEQP